MQGIGGDGALPQLRYRPIGSGSQLLGRWLADQRPIVALFPGWAVQCLRSVFQ